MSKLSILLIFTHSIIYLVFVIFNLKLLRIFLIRIIFL